MAPLSIFVTSALETPAASASARWLNPRCSRQAWTCFAIACRFMLTMISTRPWVVKGGNDDFGRFSWNRQECLELPLG